MGMTVWVLERDWRSWESGSLCSLDLRGKGVIKRGTEHLLCATDVVVGTSHELLPLNLNRELFSQ